VTSALARGYRTWAGWSRTAHALVRIAIVAVTYAAAYAGRLGGTAFYVVIAAVLLDIYLVRPVRDGRPLDDAGLGRSGAMTMSGFGLAVGAVVMSAVVGVFALAGWYRITGVFGLGTWFLGAVVLFVLVGITEEVLMRGLFWRFLERHFGTWIAFGVSSLVFGLKQHHNPHATIWEGLANAVEAGTLLGGLFLVTRTLWAPIAAHFAWNLFEGPVFGTEVSGLRDPSFFKAVVRGPGVWTGGQFGPEGGLVTLIIATGVAVAMIVYARRRLEIVPVGFRIRTKSASAVSPEAS
jgi:membrane protease YdiL (CAAX protease family)